MEVAVQQYSVDKKCFKIQKKQFLIENDRLLDQIIFQDIVNIVVNSSVNMNTSVNVHSSVEMNDSVKYVEMCNKCLELEAKLIKKHNMNNTSVNQTEPSFDQLFELNNFKAQLQAKDTTIEKLKANIKCLNKTSTTNSVKKDIDDIETINIELEHRVAKLIAKNEHLKQTYKQLYDSIKPSHGFKGKDIVDNTAQVSNATTITLGMYKLDPVTLAPKDKNNRETHIYYLKHTMEQDDILREIVKQAKSLNPLDSASYSAYNTKNDRIMHISSSTQKKNKVEDHSRIVKSCLNKSNCVVEPSGNANMQYSKLNTNSELMCVKCNGSMFDARHELYFLEFISDMNACSKSKSVKNAKKKEEFRNACPLTRITATNKVPLREPIPLKVVAQESVVTKVYTRRPKGSNTSAALSSSSSVDLSWGYDGIFSNLSLVQSLKDQIMVMALTIITFELCKKQSHKPKSEDTNQEKLYLWHMDLCGPMRVSSINRKKYILVIVDDYSRFTWVKFLASKDEALDFIIKFLKMIQVRLNMPVRNIHTDNGTEFVNQTLRSYYESVGISHETSVARSPQQNGVVERQNRTLVKAARTMTRYKPYSSTTLNPPPRDDWDRLFQPMFDKYFNPPTIIVSLVPVVNAPRAIDLADSPMSTSIDQDAPSTKSLKTPHYHDDPLHEYLHEDSTSQGSSSNVRPIHTPFESLSR
ncbi:retrovirus-related pol polyprotein from transposon TNT 1-94 [Tanacetum coccineum]